MTALLERLLPLWTEPVDGRDDPEAAFGEVYADPVVVARDGWFGSRHGREFTGGLPEGHGSGEVPRIASPMPCYPPITRPDTGCACPALTRRRACRP